jgi:hypothetical protein
MLNKLKNKPLWYQIWALTVAGSAVYYLVKVFFFKPGSFDHLIQVYALVSLLLDYFIFPKDNPDGR